MRICIARNEDTLPPKKITARKKLAAAALRRQAEARLSARTQPAAPATQVATQRLVHELQVHQIELEMQNEELVQARAESEAALRQYSDLYDFAPVGYFTLARDGTIMQANLTGARLLGVDRGKLLQRRLGVFVSAGFRLAFNTFLDKVFTSESPETCEVELLKGKNESLWVHIEAASDDTRESCRAIVVDISERKQTETEKNILLHNLGERVKELNILHRATMILQDRSKTIIETLQEITEILPTGWQYPEISAARITYDGAESTTPNYSDTRWKQSATFATPDGKHGAIEVVYLEEKPHAVEGPFLAEERNLINTLAHDVSVFCDRKQAEVRIQKKISELSALRTIDLAISSSFDLRVNLDFVLEHVCAELKVDAAGILLLNPHLLTLEYITGRGFRSNAIRHTRLQVGQGYAGQVAFDRQPLLIPDIQHADSDLTRALDLAQETFVSYYGVALIAKGQVKGVLEIFQRTPLEPTDDWIAFLEMLAGQASIAIENAQLFKNLERSNAELGIAYDATIEGWSRALDLRDKETEGHTRRVTQIAFRLARKMGISGVDLVHFRRGALLHDIGKMGIADSILLKADSLTDPEWEAMRQHPDLAYQLLSPIKYLQPALDIPYCHHEKWDGTGYPRGLKGEQIPLTARIFAIVDVWDALRSDRPYRKSWDATHVREHILAESGKHFDPQVVEEFLKLLEEIGEGN